MPATLDTRPAPRPSTAEVASHLRLSVTRLARRLRQEGGADLTPSLAAALATIERHGPLSPSALAEAERVRRPSATRAIARLEEDGLVARRDDPDDGRGCLVEIAPPGRALLRELRTRKTAFIAARLERMGERERAELERAAALLERLLDVELA